VICFRDGPIILLKGKPKKIRSVRRDHLTLRLEIIQDEKHALNIQIDIELLEFFQVVICRK
jgi:hypothetical protein